MYRKIESQFWIDPEVKSLAPLERYLFLYLITNLHTHVSGIYYLPLSSMGYETGLDPHQVSRCLKVLVDRHKVFYDELSEVVWVKKMLLYQGRGSKINLAISSHLETIKHCNLIPAFLKEYSYIKYQVNTPSDTLSNTLSDTVSDTQTCSSSKGTGTGKEQLQERERDVGKGKPRPFLSIPDYREEDNEKIKKRKAELMEQARTLGVKV